MTFDLTLSGEALAAAAEELQPRYVAYCRDHSRHPSAMRAVDRRRAPGGYLGPFIVWSGRRIEEAKHLHPEWFTRIGSLLDQDAYTAWLLARPVGAARLDFDSPYPFPRSAA